MGKVANLFEWNRYSTNKCKFSNPISLHARLVTFNPDGIFPVHLPIKEQDWRIVSLSDLWWMYYEFVDLK